MKSFIYELCTLLPAGWGPYAYFRTLEESRAQTQAANAVNVQDVEAQVENQQDERNRNTFTGLSLAHDSSSRQEENG